jgi:hypothetical protein
MNDDSHSDTTGSDDNTRDDTEISLSSHVTTTDSDVDSIVRLFKSLPPNDTLQNIIITSLSTSRNGERVRHYYAPPGKLGVVIATKKDGPVVHGVKDESSPFWGLLKKGDLIVVFFLRNSN